MGVSEPIELIESDFTKAKELIASGEPKALATNILHREPDGMSVKFFQLRSITMLEERRVKE